MLINSAIEVPVHPSNPNTPNQGNVSLYPKADGFYYKDATGTVRKLGSDGSNVGGVESQEVLERLDRLESQQKRVSVEHTHKLNEVTNISKLEKATVTTDGVEIIKSSNCYIDDFNTSDGIDINNSMNISISNGSIKLDSTQNIYTDGFFTTQPIELEKTDNITLKVAETLPRASCGDISQITESQWLAVGKDMNDRVWLFTASHRQHTTPITFYYTIYNSDGTVFMPTKTFDTDTTKYSLMFGGNVQFDFHGNAYLVANLRDSPASTGRDAGNNGSTDSGNYGTATTGSTKGNSSITLFVKFDPLGELVEYSKIHRCARTTTVRGIGTPQIPCIAFSSKGYAVQYLGGAGYLILGGATKLTTLNIYSFYTNLIDAEGELSPVSYFTATNSLNSKAYTQHEGLFVHNDDIYIISSNAITFSETRHSSMQLLKGVLTNGNILNTVNLCTLPSTYTPYRLSGGLNTWHYNKEDNHLYLLSSLNSDFTIAKYTITDIGVELVKASTVTLESLPYTVTYPFAGATPKIIDDGNLMHIAFLAQGDGNSLSSLHYICVNTECDVVVGDYLVASYDEEHINDFQIILTNGYLYFFYGHGAVTDVGNSDTALWDSHTTSIEYQILNVSTGTWHNIDNGSTIYLDAPTDKVRVRGYLKTPQYGVTPSADRLCLEYTPVDGKQNTTGSVVSTRVPSVSTTGRGVLQADYDLNGGSIDWAISYDGGTNWKTIELGTDFTFSYISAPDFRVRAILYIPDYTATSPVIRSFTIRTDSVVLHSDIEQIQINLMKTNFKVDSYTNAMKNDLIKMSIDVFTDDSHIDYSKSDCQHDLTTKTVSGNLLVSQLSTTNSKVSDILLTVDEILPEIDSKIVYYVSKDGGNTFYPLSTDVITTIPSSDSDVAGIVLKAEFYNGAILNAWAWAWN